MSEAEARPLAESRVIGPLGALSIVVGSMLGIGIFLTPGIVASNVAGLWGFFAVWIVGGLVALAGSSAYAALGAMYPHAGGDYVFLKESFGRSVAFAAGVLLFFGVFVGSIATTSVPLFAYQVGDLARAAGLGEGPAPLQLGAWSLPWQSMGAVGLIVALTALNGSGTRVSSRAQVLLTVVPFVVLTLGAMWAIVFPVAPAVAEPSGSFVSPGPAGWVVAASAVYFAYSGWNAVAYVGGEIRDPERNIPLSLIGGTLIVTALYVLLCAGFLRVLGLEGLRGTVEAGTAVAARLFGGSASVAMSALIAMALIGSVNSTILAGARIAVAASRDGMLPRYFGRLDPRTGTPLRALWLQAACASLLVLSGTFETLLALTSLAMLVMGTLSVLALFRLRRRRAVEVRGARPLGYPVLPALYVVASAVVIGMSLWTAAAGTEGAWQERFLPIFGLVLFLVTWLVHVAWSRLGGGSGSRAGAAAGPAA